jgi:RNA polymerase sigma-70 factor (ECF subfamily)
MNAPNHPTVLKAPTAEPAAARDDEVVWAVQTGAPGGFASLHAMYSRRLYKRIVSITQNAEDAEDALQDTFLRAYAAIHTFEGRSNIYSWLTRIAINAALLVLRRRRARAEILFDPRPDAGNEIHSFEIRDSAPNPEQVYDLHQRRVKLLHAIGDLNAHLRAPLQMRMTHGSAIKDIGRALNISEAAVKTRLHRARRQLSMHVGSSAARKTRLQDSFAPATRKAQVI